jgi:mannose/fructose/N-acetylgalactosamine-specific phosphotransferase system component IIC
VALLADHYEIKTSKGKPLKVCELMVLRMLKYWCENWALNRADQNIETADMKMLRHVSGQYLLTYLLIDLLIYLLITHSMVLDIV